MIGIDRHWYRHDIVYVFLYLDRQISYDDWILITYVHFEIEYIVFSYNVVKWLHNFWMKFYYILSDTHHLVQYFINSMLKSKLLVILHMYTDILSIVWSITKLPSPNVSVEYLNKMMNVSIILDHWV